MYAIQCDHRVKRIKSTPAGWVAGDLRLYAVEGHGLREFGGPPGRGLVVGDMAVTGDMLNVYWTGSNLMSARGVLETYRFDSGWRLASQWEIGNILPGVCSIQYSPPTGRLTVWSLLYGGCVAILGSLMQPAVLGWYEFQVEGGHTRIDFNGRSILVNLKVIISDLPPATKIKMVSCDPAGWLYVLYDDGTVASIVFAESMSGHATVYRWHLANHHKGVRFFRYAPGESLCCIYGDGTIELFDRMGRSKLAYRWSGQGISDAYRGVRIADFTADGLVGGMLLPGQRRQIVLFDVDL